MPEVSLGLIPGATGITKTVRRLGLMAAQPYLLEGKLFGAARGARDRLGRRPRRRRADELARAWRSPGSPRIPTPRSRGTERDYRMPGGTPASPKIAAALAVAPAMLAQKTRGLYPATQAILETMVEGALVDYDTATRIESRKLAKVMVGADREEHDPGVLLRRERDPLGPCAAEGRAGRGGRRRSASSAPA